MSMSSERLLVLGSDERAVQACREACPACGAPASRACGLPDGMWLSAPGYVVVCRARLVAAPGTALGLAPRPRPLEGEAP